MRTDKYHINTIIFNILFISSIIFLTFVGTICEAQNPFYTTSRNRKALSLYALSTISMIDGKNEDAIVYLIAALRYDKKYIDAYMRLSKIYQSNGEKELEEEQYLNVIKINPYYPDAYYNYGKLLMNKKEFSEAKKVFEIYQNIAPYDARRYKYVQNNIEQCKFRDYAIKHPVPFKPKNIGHIINTKLDEYWGVLTADSKTLYFTRKLEIDTNAFDDFFKYNEDIFVSYLGEEGWSEPIPAPGSLNSISNEGAIAISPDGKFLLFTGCQRKDSYGRCDIYYSEFRDGKWMKPINIGSPINTKDKEVQSSISYDGKTLYFVSNRKGSYGGLDIWKSDKKEDGSWDEPVNLGPKVNSKGDEQSPFIHPDNKTLFFSSNGKIGMGNSDLFIARKNKDGDFEFVKNLGYPINTEEFEYSLFVTSDGRRAYYASEKEGGFGRLDIYEFELHKDNRPNPVIYVKGTVYDKDTYEKLKARFEFIDKETGDLVYETYSDENSGKFLEALPLNKNYSMSVSKKEYIFYSENLPTKGSGSISVEKDIHLSQVKVGEKIILNDIFYEFDSTKLRNESNFELNKVINFLKEYPNLKIEIGGHTDNLGGKDYNLKLSLLRAEKVFYYLVNYGKIDKNRLTYKGYGEGFPIESNITEEGRMNNRRTEFKITGM